MYSENIGIFLTYEIFIKIVCKTSKNDTIYYNYYIAALKYDYKNKITMIFIKYPQWCKY